MITDAQLFEAGVWWLAFCSACCFAFLVVLWYDDRKYNQSVEECVDRGVTLWRDAQIVRGDGDAA